MTDKKLDKLSIDRDNFLKEHKETSLYIAKLALTSTENIPSFKSKLANFYKAIFTKK